MTISFSNEEIQTIAAKTASTGEVLASLVPLLDQIREDFNNESKGTITSRSVWGDPSVNTIRPKGEEIQGIVDEVTRDFQEVAKRQKELAAAIVEFATSNKANEEEAVASMENQGN